MNLISAKDGAGLRVEHWERGLLRLTLSRPERGNALNGDLLSGLTTEIESAKSDETVRFVVMCGAGKHFCGGADIGGAARNGAPRIADVVALWEALPKPTVAFVHGACIGAGVALASCADLVVASPDAFFAMPEVRLGMTPGLLPVFIRAVGERAFRRYGLSGERFDVRAAEACGLVGQVSPIESWPDVEATLLNAFLEAAPRALGRIKLLTLAHRSVPPAASIAITGDHENPESIEGKASFKEKRKPSWWIGP